VLRYDGTTGAPIGTGIFVSPGSAGLNGASGLTFGPDGNLYVTSVFTNEVLRYNGTTGAPIGTGVFVAAGSAGLDGPFGLTFGPDGNLYVASSGTDEILRYDGTTGAPVGDAVFVSTGSAGLVRPESLLFFTPQVGIPEPSTLTLLATGLVGLLAYSWRRATRSSSGAASRPHAAICACSSVWSIEAV